MVYALCFFFDRGLHVEHHVEPCSSFAIRFESEGQRCEFASMASRIILSVSQSSGFDRVRFTARLQHRKRFCGMCSRQKSSVTGLHLVDE